MNEIQTHDKALELNLALIKRTVAPGATDDELAMFIHDCKRRGVHPLDKLIVFTHAGGKYTPITTIDYMRSRAAESGEMAGSDDATFVHEASTPSSATVTVYRLTNGTKYPYSATARFREYYRNTPTWNHMPHTMLAKCAEALALRKAFPHQLAGLYTREEMQQAMTEDETGDMIIADAANVFDDLDQTLRDAAEQGMGALQVAWGEFSPEEKRMMKMALDQRHKPRAQEIDSLSQAPEGGGMAKSDKARAESVARADNSHPAKSPKGVR
jgi:phage recombination protein Bet